MRHTKIRLNNGYPLPLFGYGTWQIPDGEGCATAVAKAIEAGFRLIDTASAYGNEKSVGLGIRASGLEREKIYVTTKVWNKDRGYVATRQAFERSLNELQLEYVDLYLIHWPASSHQFSRWEALNMETWQAMTELYKAGKIKAIGVSNFMPHHLQPLMAAEVVPAVNQIEYHPGYLQMETILYCRRHNIMLEGYSPLGTGQILNHPVITAIAAAHKASPAQVCIRWAMQNNVIPLPKTVKPERMVENYEIDGFSLTAAEIRLINELPFIGGSALHPDKIDF